MNEKIQKADEGLRKRELIKALIIFVIGIIIYFSIKLFSPSILESFKKNPIKTINYIRGVSVFIIVIILLPVFYHLKKLWKISNQTVVSKRYPPPDTPVIKDTKILQGDSAVKKGKSLKMIVISVAVLFLIFTVLFEYLIIIISGSVLNNIARMP